MTVLTFTLLLIMRTSQGVSMLAIHGLQNETACNAAALVAMNAMERITHSEQTWSCVPVLRDKKERE